ncbi:MAG: 2-amino-4-hydroxy-6-hydroxymethyldihydropteridine diphosphokinase [Kangiellaceae bacterium]
MTTSAYIGLGANLNNPKQQIEVAFKALANLPNTQLLLRSSLYQSPPMGPRDQDDYINAVAKIETSLTPIDLLDQLQSVEKTQGRVRKAERWGPRTLDLDLLLFGDQAIECERLTIPHYGLRQRAFVLLPLQEIAPELKLPDGTPINSIVEELTEQGITKL